MSKFEFVEADFAQAAVRMVEDRVSPAEACARIANARLEEMLNTLPSLELELGDGRPEGWPRRFRGRIAKVEDLDGKD